MYTNFIEKSNEIALMCTNTLVLNKIKFKNYSSLSLIISLFKSSFISVLINDLIESVFYTFVRFGMKLKGVSFSTITFL